MREERGVPEFENDDEDEVAELEPIDEGSSSESGREADGLGAGPGRRTGEEVLPESAEEMEELEEVEELEEAGEEPVPVIVEELPPDAPSDKEPVPEAELQFERRVSDLVKYKRLEVYSLADLQSMDLGAADAAIEMSDGVYQIREEVYRAPDRDAANRELQNLVHSVSGSGEAAAEGPEVDELESGWSIPTVELSLEGLTDSSQERDAGPERRGSGHRRREKGLTLLTASGFDYDVYLQGFRQGTIGVMKSLMRISQSLNAIYAAILTPGEGGLVAEFGLGLDDASLKLLRYPAADLVYRKLFSRKNLVYVRLPRTGIREFDSKMASRDQKFIAGTIYLPIVFHGNPAYLFFGLKNSEATIHECLSLLLGAA